jgi:Fe-S-cluster containining protein
LTVPIHVLAFHALYRCRHAGVCCTSGWTIPVEAPLYRSLKSALEWGQLRPDGLHRVDDLFEPVTDLPDREPVVLRRKPDGSCVFFERGRGNLCAIQRQIDHAHLPSACRHFPRVAVIDPRGTFVTLSHVCPTAARMLLEEVAGEVVTSGPVIEHHLALEGLDARDALPPLIRPDLLWNWDGWDRWERGSVALLARNDRSIEGSLGALLQAVRAVRTWGPSDGPLEDAVAVALEAAVAPAEPLALSDASLLRLCSAVEASIPAALKPSGLAVNPTFDVPGWDRWRGPVGRYLSARAFANWVGYYGADLHTWFASVLSAYAVLRACAAARIADGGAPEDPEVLLQALADADRLVVHLASAPALAAELDEWEIDK